MLPFCETFWNNTSSQRRRSAPTVTSWFSSQMELTLHRDGLTINRRLTMPTSSHRGPDLLDTHASIVCRAPTHAPGSALGNLHNFFHDPWDGDVENVDGPLRRSGSENNYLNPGSPTPRTRTKKSSRKIRRIFFKPSSRLIVVWWWSQIWHSKMYYEFCYGYELCSQILAGTLVISGTWIREEMVRNIFW